MPKFLLVHGRLLNLKSVEEVAPACRASGTSDVFDADGGVTEIAVPFELIVRFLTSDQNVLDPDNHEQLESLAATGSLPVSRAGRRARISQ